MVNNRDAFSPDYFSARDRFREKARALGWLLESHPIQARGPDNRELSIDIAMSSNNPASRTLVVSSGVHGVEGFFGSAVQIAMMDHFLEKKNLPADYRFVLVHAISPYGFAWVRRFDENNVDQNRNFLIPGEKFEGTPQGYPKLDHILNPRRPPSRWDFFKLTAVYKVLTLGMPAMKEAIVCGQHDYPRGIFFGGHEPSESLKILDTNFDRWLLGCRDAIHLDFHTGLGEWKTHKLLIDSPLNERQKTRVEKCFGMEKLEVSSTEGVSYDNRGGFGKWCTSRWGRDYLYLCAEFGTYGPITMLAGIRAENQAHQWGKPVSPSTKRAKTKLKQLFVPESREWREKTIRDAITLIEKAISGG